MKTYLISYDLKKNRDYEELYKKLKSYTNWAHISESLWAIISDKGAAGLRDEIKTAMDNDDSVFVILSGKEAAWSNVICNGEWLQKNL